MSTVILSHHLASCLELRPTLVFYFNPKYWAASLELGRIIPTISKQSWQWHCQHHHCHCDWKEIHCLNPRAGSTLPRLSPKHQWMAKLNSFQSSQQLDDIQTNYGKVTIHYITSAALSRLFLCTHIHDKTTSQPRVKWAEAEQDPGSIHHQPPIPCNRHWLEKERMHCNGQTWAEITTMKARQYSQLKGTQTLQHVMGNV